MRIATGVLAALLSTAAQDEGEALFKQMEETLLKTKTLSFKAAVSTQGERLGQGRLEGTVVLEQPRKLRALLEGRVGNEERKIQVTADGKDVKWVLTGFGDNKGPAPEKMNRNLLLFLSRANLFDGVFMGAGLEWAEGDHDAAGRLRVARFKAAGTEKVGDVEARKVEYLLDCTELKARWEATVWIDPKTKLPLKRVLKATDASRDQITETFSAFKVDEKADPAAFQIPK